VAWLLNDHSGPRLVAMIGGILFSLGFFLASFTNSLLTFYLTIGICVGMGNGFGYVVPTSVGSKWFPDKRGLIVGLMVGGYGAGSGVLVPSRPFSSNAWVGERRFECSQHCSS
jgi:OFA family oxalate/formate antiporter-like MFS transporter